MGRGDGRELLQDGIEVAAGKACGAAATDSNARWQQRQPLASRLPLHCKDRRRWNGVHPRALLVRLVCSPATTSRSACRRQWRRRRLQYQGSVCCLAHYLPRPVARLRRSSESTQRVVLEAGRSAAWVAPRGAFFPVILPLSPCQPVSSPAPPCEHLPCSYSPPESSADPAGACTLYRVSNSTPIANPRCTRVIYLSAGKRTHSP